MKVVRLAWTLVMAMQGLVSAYPVSSGPPTGGQLSAGLSPHAEQNPAAALEAAVKSPSSARTQSDTDLDQVRIPAAEKNAAKQRRKGRKTLRRRGRKKQQETGLTSLLSPDADDSSPSSPLPAASRDRRQRRRQGDKARKGRGKKNNRRHRKKRKGKKRNNTKRLGESGRGGKHRQKSKSKVNCNDRHGQQNVVDSSPSQPDKSAEEGMQVVASSSECDTQPTSSLKQQKNSRKLYDSGEDTRRRGSQESRKEQSRWADLLKETYLNATDIERRNSGRSEQLDTESDTPEVVATLGIRLDASVSVSARLSLNELYASASDIVPPDQPRSSGPFHPLNLNQLYQQRVDITHQNSAESAGSRGRPPGSPAHRDKRSAAIDLRDPRWLASAVDIERRPTRGRSKSLTLPLRQLFQTAVDLVG